MTAVSKAFASGLRRVRRDAAGRAGFALTSLRGNLAKSLLTVLGLGVGVGAVLTVLSLGDAGEIRVEEEIARLGVDKVWFCAEIQRIL